jgi:hypothetical protein
MKESESFELTRYDAMCQAIDRAFDVDEVKEIHDRAIALEAYFRQAKNPEPERRACEIRLRAERKAGKLLKAMEKNKGGPGRPIRSPEEWVSEYGQALRKNQIPYTTAERWQQLATVPDEEFEAALGGSEKPSTSGIIEANRPQQEPMYPKALSLWGMLRDFERDLFDEDPKFLLSQMLDTMQADVRRLAPLVTNWLKEINQDDRRTEITKSLTRNLRVTKKR